MVGFVCLIARQQAAIDKPSLPQLAADYSYHCPCSCWYLLVVKPPAAADERWKAIRKAVAVSFSAQNIKRKFPMILERVNEIVVRSAKLGPKASIDVVSAARTLL